MAAKDQIPKVPSDEEESEPLKMTVYLPLALVDALDALKVEDQAAKLVRRHMTRPQYVAWALERYAELRGVSPKETPPTPAPLAPRRK